jgi:hypothetical protein
MPPFGAEFVVDALFDPLEPFDDPFGILLGTGLPQATSVTTSSKMESLMTGSDGY